MSTKQKRFILPEDEIPKYWYNIQADMKTKPMPPLESQNQRSPETRRPLSYLCQRTLPTGTEPNRCMD